MVESAQTLPLMTLDEIDKVFRQGSSPTEASTTAASSPAYSPEPVPAAANPLPVADVLTPGVAAPIGIAPLPTAPVPAPVGVAPLPVAPVPAPVGIDPLSVGIAPLPTEVGGALPVLGGEALDGTAAIAVAPVKKKKGPLSIIFSIIFYSLIALIVLAAYLFSGSGTGPPRNFFGYSAMTVLTRSMQQYLPQGSLIITRVTPADDLSVGDDITYLLSNNSTITHRIIGIYENHENTGERGFKTQGTNNPLPDSEIVLARNVIGQVIFTSLTIGRVIAFVRRHVLVIGILAVLVIAFVIAMKMVLFPKGAPNKPGKGGALPQAAQPIPDIPQQAMQMPEQYPAQQIPQPQQAAYPDIQQMPPPVLPPTPNPMLQQVPPTIPQQI